MMKVIEVAVMARVADKVAVPMSTLAG